MIKLTRASCLASNLSSDWRAVTVHARVDILTFRENNPFEWICASIFQYE